MTGRPRSAATDVFAVPSGSTVQFVLVAATASAIAPTALSWFVAAFATSTAWKQSLTRWTECYSRANANGLDVVVECGFRPVDAPSWLAPSSLVFFWLIVLVVWLATPPLRRRRRRYVLLDAVDPGLGADLDQLARLCGVNERIRWYVDAVDPRIEASAFGIPYRRSVVLSLGLVKHTRQDPGQARAILLHELAHIRNRDLDQVSLTQAIWAVSALSVALYLFNALPGIVVMLVNWALGYDRSLTWPYVVGTIFLSVQIVVTVGLLRLMRRRLVRLRENYADIRVLTWSDELWAAPARDAVVHMLDGWEGVADSRAVPRSGHPSRERRLAVLADSSVLLRLPAWQACAAGFVAGTLFSAFFLVTSLRPQDSLEEAVWHGSGALIATSLVVAVLGLTAVQAIYGFGDPVRVVAAPVIWMSLGLVAGCALSGLFWRSAAFTGLWWEQAALWCAITIVGLLIVAGWVMLLCRAWLASRARWHPARFTGLVGGASLALWPLVDLHLGMSWLGVPYANQLSGTMSAWRAYLATTTQVADIVMPLPVVVVGLLAAGALTVVELLLVLVRARRRRDTPGTGDRPWAVMTRQGQSLETSVTTLGASRSSRTRRTPSDRAVPVAIVSVLIVVVLVSYTGYASWKVVEYKSSVDRIVASARSVHGVLGGEIGSWEEGIEELDAQEAELRRMTLAEGSDLDRARDGQVAYCVSLSSYIKAAFIRRDKTSERHVDDFLEKHAASQDALYALQLTVEQAEQVSEIYTWN